jgi:hypothetical protein
MYAWTEREAVKMDTLAFNPVCLNCGEPLGEIRSLGLAMEGGSVECPHCGESHNYTILDGKLSLRRFSVPTGYTGPVERVFSPEQSKDTRSEVRDGASLHEAAEKGDLSRVQQLLASDANLLEAKNEEGDTPLHKAAAEGHAEVAKFLITQGADVNAVGRNDDRPLHRAAFFGRKDVVELLLANGADIEARDRQDNTPLIRAATFHTEVVQLLLDKGADVNARNVVGNTALSAVENMLKDLKHLGSIVAPGGMLRMEAVANLLRQRGAKSKAESAGSQCFIATAACGSPLAPEVETLRAFRDTVLRARPVGEAFVRLYERVSPSLARWMEPRAGVRWIVRTFLIAPLAALVKRVMRR